jgi:hypothetical protein
MNDLRQRLQPFLDQPADALKVSEARPAFDDFLEALECGDIRSAERGRTGTGTPTRG